MEIALEVIEKRRLSVSVCADRSDYGNVSFLNVGVVSKNTNIDLYQKEKS